MAYPPFQMRTVREELDFRAALEGIEPDPQKSDAILDGICWALARNPEAGVQIPFTRVWMLSINDSFSFRAATLYYAFDDQLVYLLDLVLQINDPEF